MLAGAGALRGAESALLRGAEANKGEVVVLRDMPL